MRTTIRIGLTLCFLSACSLAPGDDAESLEQETRVKPHGAEGFTSGTLVVTVPKGAPKLAPTILRLGRTDRPAGASLDEHHLDEVISLPIGTYDLLVDGAKKPFASVVIEGGKQATLTLPVLAPIAFTPTPAPKEHEPVTFDFGPKVAPYQPFPTNLPLSLLPGEIVYDRKPFGSGLGLLLAPGASYRVERGAPNAETRDVLATLDVPKKGAAVYTLPAVSDAWETSNFDVPTAELEVTSLGSDFPAQMTAVIWDCRSFADSKQNLEVCSPGDVLCSHLNTIHGASILFGTNVVAPKKTIKGKLFAHPECTYRLSLTSGDIAIDITRPKTSLKVGYIDVEDVVITHEGGTKRTVKGVFTLQRVPGPGQNPVALGGAWDTGQAVPVAPGTYVVLVSYKNNAAEQTYTETVTVP